jgi:hypothetical protein
VKARPGNGRRSRDPALDQPILLSEPLIFLDVTPRWTCEGIYQFVKPITPGMNCTRKSGQTAGACGTEPG